MVLKYIFQTILLPLNLFYVSYHRLRRLKKHYVMQINIEGDINEKPPTVGFLQYLNKNSKFYDIILELYNVYTLLKEESLSFRKKQTLIINIHSNTLGWSQTWELQQILKKVSELNVSVFSYLYDTSLQSYFLALPTTKIYASPAFSLFFSGIRQDAFFFKDAFERFGIKANFISLGKYKSAAEKYTKNKASKFAHTQLKTIFDHIYNSIQSQILHHRVQITSISLKKIQTKHLINAKEAHATGLIDDVIYPEQMKELIQAKYQLKKPLETISLTKVIQRLNSRQKKYFNLATKVKIALVVGEGPIIDSTKETDNTISYPTYKRTFRKLQNSHFNAIILRWNSPGGSAFTSDLIWNEIMKLQEKSFKDPMRSIQLNKPLSKKEKKHSQFEQKIYVSQSNVAASGGYYLSAINQRVYATPFTITGSIGVLMGKFNIQPMLKKTLSLNIDSIETKSSSNLFSPFHDFDNQQKEAILESMQDIYTLFCHRIATGRHMDEQTIRSLGEGKVYHGHEAVKNGLIDYEGGLVDIIEEIRKSSKSKNNIISVQILPKIKKRFFDKKQMLPSFIQKYMKYKMLENQILYLDKDLLKLFK